MDFSIFSTKVCEKTEFKVFIWDGISSEIWLDILFCGTKFPAKCQWSRKTSFPNIHYIQYNAPNENFEYGHSHFNILFYLLHIKDKVFAAKH